MLEKHHITFKSQEGLDFELNYIYLSSGNHRGNKGPHKNREKDLEYKRELQSKLEEILYKDYYTIEELIKILGLEERQAYKAFRKLEKVKGIKRKDIIFRLMGDSFYL